MFTSTNDCVKYEDYYFEESLLYNSGHMAGKESKSNLQWGRLIIIQDREIND